MLTKRKFTIINVTLNLILWLPTYAEDCYNIKRRGMPSYSYTFICGAIAFDVTMHCGITNKEDSNNAFGRPTSKCMHIR